MFAPAILAMRGLHTPQATTTYSASMRPLLVTTAEIWPFLVSRSSTSVLANTCKWPAFNALSRIKVPVCSESTTDTLGV